MSLGEWISDNSRTLLFLGAGYIAYVELGSAEYPTLPESSGLVVVVALAVAGVGYIAAGKIEGLLPDEEGIYLVALDASDQAGGAVWELSEDQFEDMTVHAGTLFQWPVSKRVYEVREYDPMENKAVANWRESVAASELAGEVEVVDALEAIAELRDEFEPAAQRFRIIQRRLRSVARKMDRRRDRDQQAILDPHLSPTFGDDRAGISEVLDEEMPDHLLPKSMQADKQQDIADEENGEFAGFELLDGTADGLDPDPEVMSND